MKKAVTYAMAMLMTAAVCSPVPVKAAGSNRVTIACKETPVKWTSFLESCGIPGNCLEWGAIFWQGSCPVWPDETPDKPTIPETPDETPEIPSGPETPGGTPETPDEPETPSKPGVPETPNKPETPSKPETPDETPETPNEPETPNKPGIPEIPNKPNTPDEMPETPSKPETPDETPDAGNTYAQQVVALVNIERRKEGLSPLTIDEKLTAAADIRSGEIQTTFSHTRPNGSSFSTALKEAGAVYKRSGENIAWGQKTPEEVVKAWMNSAGHRANIMNKNYSRIGVSHVKNAAGTSYWVQLFAD